MRSRGSKAAADEAGAHPDEVAEPDRDAAEESAARAGSSHALQEASEEAEEAADKPIGGKSLEELAVRFSQATKELQASLHVQSS